MRKNSPEKRKITIAFKANVKNAGRPKKQTENKKQKANEEHPGMCDGGIRENEK